MKYQLLKSFITIAALTISSLALALQPPKPEKCPSIEDIKKTDVLSQEWYNSYISTISYLETRNSTDENWAYRSIVNYSVDLLASTDQGIKIVAMSDDEMNATVNNISGWYYCGVNGCTQDYKDQLVKQFKQAKEDNFPTQLEKGPFWLSRNGDDGAWICKYKQANGAAYATIPSNFNLLDELVK